MKLFIKCRPKYNYIHLKLTSSIITRLLPVYYRKVTAANLESILNFLNTTYFLYVSDRPSFSFISTFPFCADKH